MIVLFPTWNFESVIRIVSLYFNILLRLCLQTWNIFFCNIHAHTCVTHKSMCFGVCMWWCVCRVRVYVNTLLILSAILFSSQPTLLRSSPHFSSDERQHASKLLAVRLLVYLPLVTTGIACHFRSAQLTVTDRP